MNQDDDHFLTTDEMMALLQVNPRTIYRLIRHKRLPAVRVGRQWRCRRRDLDLWLAKERAGLGPGAIEVERPRILVVDDEATVRDVVAGELLRADYDVETASDGASAVERLREKTYDLLITDLKMPGMDGLSVIREARRRSADMPIIIITGYSTEASAIEAINLGVSGYLTKPFRLPRIVTIAARAMGEPPPPEYLEAIPEPA
jgi:excisionase family DNA binding protein